MCSSVFLGEIYINVKIRKGREEVTMLEATANDDDNCCCLQTDKRQPHTVGWGTKASMRKGRAAQQLAGFLRGAGVSLKPGVGDDIPHEYSYTRPSREFVRNSGTGMVVD